MSPPLIYPALRCIVAWRRDGTGLDDRDILPAGPGRIADLSSRAGLKAALCLEVLGGERSCPDTLL